jgi:lipopolysaccharide assembly protein A
MNFLKTLFWVVVAVFLAIFATRNWADVTINLWGNIQADVKLPVLIFLAFLIGFLPPFLILRGRIWALKRKLAVAERPIVPTTPTPPVTTDEEVTA